MMVNALVNYLVLPKVCSDFEEHYLKRMNRIAMWFFVAHLPILGLIAFLNDTGAGLAVVLTALTLCGPLIAMKFLDSKRQISTMMGIAAMLMGGLLVHFGQGPVQIEMHFYFFVLLALLAVFANPMVIVAAAVTAAVHHALLWYFLPSSVFNYSAPFWVVAVHAAFVVLESVAACFIARSFFDNVIGLERKVAERTSQLESRNQDMRRLLDSVEQGFFTVDCHGRVSEERSKAVETFLGKIDSEITLVELVGRHDSKAADWLELGLDEAFMGIMPVEVTLSQLPSRCVVDDRHLDFQYNPVLDGEELHAIAVVVTDVTAEVARQQLETENRDMMAMIDRIAKDKSGFLEFFQEAEDIIEALRNESRDDLPLVKRRIHTLKGNAAIFGLQRVADACHRIEDFVDENACLPEGVAWTELFGCWASTRGNLRRILNDTTAKITLDDAEYDAVLRGILNNEPKDVLATRVAAWKLEPTDSRLQRLAEQAKSLAVRLGKGHINVNSSHNGLRIDPSTWSEFWSTFVHVVRNAVDHGLESAEDRRVLGKAEVGALSLSTTVEGEKFIVAISDDGRGIDWEKVGKLAGQRDLPTDTQQGLIDALFADGLSTADTVSDTSGRGIGMGAVRESCTQLGGQIEVDSSPEVGTTMRFVFPIEAMAKETIQHLNRHGIESPERSFIGAVDANEGRSDVGAESGEARLPS